MIGSEVEIVIGIDPGKSGAIVAVQKLSPTQFKVHSYIDIQRVGFSVNIDELRAYLVQFDPLTTVIVSENPHTHANDGMKTFPSVFEYGKSVGIIRGLCYGIDYVTLFVAPSKWKHDLCITSPKSTKQEKKELAMLKALEIMDKENHTIIQYSSRRNGVSYLVNKFDRAEAFLMGVWGFNFIIDKKLNTNITTNPEEE